jgi:hypothetical protein
MKKKIFVYKNICDHGDDCDCDELYIAILDSEWCPLYCANNISGKQNTQLSDFMSFEIGAETKYNQCVWDPDLFDGCVPTVTDIYNDLEEPECYETIAECYLVTETQTVKLNLHPLLINDNAARFLGLEKIELVPLDTPNGKQYADATKILLKESFDSGENGYGDFDNCLTDEEKAELVEACIAYDARCAKNKQAIVPRSAIYVQAHEMTAKKPSESDLCLKFRSDTVPNDILLGHYNGKYVFVRSAQS